MRMYKLKTSEDINIHMIKTSSKKLRKGLMTLKQANLNKRFERLKRDNLGMYEEMYPKYIALVRDMNKK